MYEQSSGYLHYTSTGFEGECDLCGNFVRCRIRALNEKESLKKVECCEKCFQAGQYRKPRCPYIYKGTSFAPNEGWGPTKKQQKRIKFPEPRLIAECTVPDHPRSHQGKLMVDQTGWVVLFVVKWYGQNTSVTRGYDAGTLGVNETNLEEWTNKLLETF